MPKTGENIYRRKDGRWEGRYVKERVDGKIKYGAVYARSYRDVKRKLEEAKAAQREKSRAQAGMRAGKIAELGYRWLSEMTLTLKDSSINKYEDILRHYIVPELGETEVSEISNQCILDFVNGLLMKGGIHKQGLAPSTVSEILSVLNGIRIYAMRRDYLVRFSLECVSLKRVQTEIRVFSREEEELLVRYLLEHMDFSALGILLCLFTGIRVGELCAMNWDDISLSERSMRISKTMQRLRMPDQEGGRTKVKIQEPKSACSVRTIPLPGILMGLLKEYHNPGTFLLTGENSRYVEPRTMQNRFKKMLFACGISDANFHTTRHTFATRCIELGFDVKTLSEILGHADVAITMNRYVHPSMALKAEHMERLSELFTVK